MLVKVPPAPVSVAAPWSWTGFYIGGHIGGALETSKLDDPFGAVSYGDNVTTAGFIAGGQVGADYQIGHVVIGGEADLSWITSRGDETCFGLAGGNFFASNCSVDPTLFGTVTGRLGYAFDRTLVYAKGGAAWEHTNVDMAVNLNPGNHFLASATSYGAWGWTVGGGVEYALTPAWSLMLEYDYLGFGTANVATPYVAGNPLPGSPVGPIAGLSSNVQEVRLGVNYKLGADPAAAWPASTSRRLLMSFSSLSTPTPWAFGWEIVGGSRYMFSSGREQWEQAFANAPTWFSSSKLTWNNLNSNSAELFGRVDTPWNVFVSGFIGAGDTVRGGSYDEDFHGPVPSNAYNNTFSTNNGGIYYAVVDLGYNVLRSADYKVGPFVGYTVFNQSIFKSGCQQVASPTGNCIAGGSSLPLPSSQLIGLEDMTWQALRVGLSGQVALADRVTLAADAAFLPYVGYTWLDDHLDSGDQHLMFGQGIGVQTQAVLSYNLTDRLSIGIGGRYWAMWSTSAVRQYIPPTSDPGPNRNTVELAGAFAQAAYRFAPGDPAAAKSGLFAFIPTKPAAPAKLYDWTGFYVGIEGGGIWGRSQQIGETVDRHTFDATPEFDVDGGMLGGTVGYNSRFDRTYVFGFEGDMSWLNASGSARQLAPFDVAQVAATKEDWLATARARIGVTPVDRLLIYATGGLAVADVEASIAPATVFAA
ncbi:MAG: outer membrane beta-barrel protein [Xanthobacteraceae bacterium]